MWQRCLKASAWCSLTCLLSISQSALSAPTTDSYYANYLAKLKTSHSVPGHFSPDNSLLAVSGINSGLWRVSDLIDYEGSQTLPPLASLRYTIDLSFNHDGSLILGCDFGSIDIWYTSALLEAVSNGKTPGYDGETPAFKEVNVGKGVNHCRFSPDGRYILTSSYKDGALLWKTDDLLALAENETPVPTATLKAPHSQSVSFASFNHKGTLIATTGNGGVLIWRLNDLEALTSGQQPTPAASLKYPSYLEVTFADFSHNDKVLFTSSIGTAAHLWKASETSVQDTSYVTLTHADRINDGAFNVDDNMVVTSSKDNTSKVWRTSDGKLLATLHNNGPVEHSEFSHDNQLIVSNSSKGTKIWLTSSLSLVAPDSGSDSDTPTGQSIFPVGSKNEGGSLFSSFNNDGTMLLSVGKSVAQVCWTNELYKNIGETHHSMEVELDALKVSESETRIELHQLEKQFRHLSKKFRKHQRNNNAHQ